MAVKRKRKRGAKRPSALWTVADNIWFAFRVFVGTVLLIPVAILGVIAYIITPRVAWNWYKSWTEAPPSKPTTKQSKLTDEFPAPRYIPVDTETEINESQRNCGSSGTQHS